MIEKIINQDGLKAWLKEHRTEADKLVFTNGCFDVIHAGHVSCLAAAKSCGSLLIVAVNDDASVKRLKGSNRPINFLEDRMNVLSAMTAIDAVVSFSEDTPLSLIKTIMPDVLVKGGDYTIDEIVGASEVKAHGGQVVIVPTKEGFSSTSIIEKISNQS